MRKRRERALHLFQLTGRERAVNRLHVDKLSQRIVQKTVAAVYDRRHAAQIFGTRRRVSLHARNDEARMTNDEGMTKTHDEDTRRVFSGERTLLACWFRLSACAP